MGAGFSRPIVAIIALTFEEQVDFAYRAVHEMAVDPQVTPQNSTIYYNNVLKTVGKQAGDSIALFMLPGVYHCQGGPGPDTFDRMAVLEQWVEQGRKPTRIIASKSEDGKIVRTRPLCPFGQVAKWNGTGSTDDAASFACAAETVDTSIR